MTDQKTKQFSGYAKALGDRQVRVAASSAFQDRHSDVVRQEGLDLAAFRSNPVVLFNHDHGEPVARVENIGMNAGRVEATVQFPPEGTSAKSDETYRLVKSNILNAVSIGFRVKRFEVMEDGGWDILESELYELSFVSVPANPDAVVLERGLEVGNDIVTEVRERAEQTEKDIAEIRADVVEIKSERAAEAARRRADAERRVRLQRVLLAKGLPYSAG